MSFTNDPKHGEPQSDDQNRALMDSVIRRQRLWMLTIGLILIIGLGASFFGFYPEILDSGEPQSNSLRHGDDKPTTIPANSQTPSSNSPAQPIKPAEAQTPKASTLNSQSIAVRTESMVIVAWPTIDSLEDSSTFPKKKQWLPKCVEAIGMDLCDRNRALESGFTGGASRMLPRMGAHFIPKSLTDVQMAAEVKHAMVVEFKDDGSAWRIHRKTHRTHVVSENWVVIPESGAIALLIDQLVEAASAATDYSISGLNVFTRKDDAAVAYAELEDAITKFRDRGGNDREMFVTSPDANIENAVSKVLSIDPTFDFAVYRRSITAYEFQNRTLAMDLLRERIKNGGTSPRQPTLLGMMMVQSGDAALHAEGLKLLLAEVEREPLNLSAYTYWSQAWFSRPDDGTGETGSINQAKHALERYPLDGRFQALMAKELCTNPATADEALVYAAKCEELRPWNHSIGFHIGMAHFSKLEYQPAAEAFLSYWAFDPNRLGNWVEMIARSLTENARRLPPASNVASEPITDYAGFIYMLTMIARQLASTEYGAILDRLFEKRRAEYETYLHDAAAKAKPDDNNYAIILMADVALALSDGQKGKLGSPENTQATIMKAIKRYRDWGGRAYEIEKIWKLAKATGHAGK